MCSHVSVAPVAHILRRLFHTPYAVITHGIEIWGPLGARQLAALRDAALVVAVSHFTARLIAAKHGVPEDRVMVIHPAVDPALLRWCPRTTSGPLGVSADVSDRGPPVRAGAV